MADRIIVIGSLNPEKECQDRVRVLSGGGTAKYQIVCEQRCDEGIRFFQDGCCGTIRTIDGGGDKRVLEQIIEVPTTKT